MPVKFLLSLLFIFTISIQSFSRSNSEGYGIGDKVSDFSISNYDGKTYTLSNAGSKATVIIFLSSTCPFVQPYTQRLINLSNEFGPQGITFWGINSNSTEPTDQVVNHAKEKNYNFPVLKDIDNIVADQFAASHTPEVYVVDNSTMQLIYHGRIDDNKEEAKVTSNDLSNALNEFLSGKEISLKETKAFGCSVKRK